MKFVRWGLPILLALAFVTSITTEDCSAGRLSVDPEYEKELKKYRAERQERLVSDTYYLTLAGLFWLEKGENTFGTDPRNTVVLPEGSCDPKVGSIVLEYGLARLKTFDGRKVMVDGKTVETALLRPDSEESPSIVTFGDVSFWIIERGGQLLVRMRDLDSPTRKHFQGVSFFEPSDKYRVEARLEPYEKPKELQIVDVIGTVSTNYSPGSLVFSLDGKEHRLDPQLSELDSDKWFLVFMDETSGVESYANGRYLVFDAPKEGKTILDFNKAYNPPCAFSPYTTCPLPAEGNVLEVAIPAGEKLYDADHAAH